MKANLLTARGLTSLGARHPWKMIGAWIGLVAIVIVLSGVIGGSGGGFAGGAGLTVEPDSVKGETLIDEHFGVDERASDVIVVYSDSLTVDDPGFRETVDRLVSNLGGWQGDFASFANYYDLQAAGAPEAEQMVSQSRHAVIIPITFQGPAEDYETRGRDFLDQIESVSSDPVQAYGVGAISGNETFNSIVEEDLSKDMSVGMPVAAVVLLVVFGALIAAALPLLLAFLTIGVATAALTLLSNFMTVDGNANTLVIMIGLAVGVDYALFFLERFREERRHGARKVDAIDRAGATAGKAVIFSGLTVILAMLGLFLLPMDLFHGMAVGAVFVVLVAVAAALTLLPALLRLLGDWTNFPRVGLMRTLKRQDQSGIAQFAPERRGQGVWGRLANIVMRRPGIAVVISLTILIVSALAVFTMELGTQTNESLPESSFRDGALILSREFYAGVNDPLQIVVSGDGQSSNIQGVVSGLVAGIEADGAFGPATIVISPDNALTVIEFATADDPYASSTGTAIGRLRTSVIPEVTNGSNLTVLVTGDPALAFDSDQALIERLPYVFAFVLGLSFILLLVAFRSIVVPIASILMNLLSVGAAYGLTVAVFQHGWGNDVLGVMHTPVITSWIPVFLFCILFGLSMDYHVFLLSRIREHMDHSNNNEESIVVGLQSTGRIITGAALIMVAVFGSFTLGRVAEIQQLGFGLGVAVLIDATLIRTILVPATMKLLGSSNWYWPRILAWVPKVQIEGNLAPVKLQRQEADAGTLPRETQTIRPSMAAGGE